MARLTRAEQQERTRSGVLDAARAEFDEHGFADAKIDRIAERAELTRGAVYSNFPGKRALYLAVLLDGSRTSTPVAERHGHVPTPTTVRDALATFAGAWSNSGPLLSPLSDICTDGHSRQILSGMTTLASLLLALGLETITDVHETPARDAPLRRVRLAELAFSLVHGSDLLDKFTPGFGDPFDRSAAIEHLSTLDLEDRWAPSHQPYVRPASVPEMPYPLPSGTLTPVDSITGEAIDLASDGILVVLGAHKVGAVEETVRSVPAGGKATLVLDAGDSAETALLMHLLLGGTMTVLRQVFPLSVWTNVNVVVDDGTVSGLLTSIEGLTSTEVTEETEVAVCVRNGAVISHASGTGAALATGVHSPLASQ